MTKVLLVEDDNNLREIYEARLAAEGYDIVTAKDGEEALEVAKQHRPELIISDVMMPRISGFEMLDILRATDGLKNAKIIMLTALGQTEDKARADHLGADRYLVKSQVTLEDIVKSAEELLNGVEAPIDESEITPTSFAPEPAPVAAPATPAINHAVTAPMFGAPLQADTVQPVTPVAAPAAPEPTAIASLLPMPTIPLTPDVPAAPTQPAATQTPAPEPVNPPVDMTQATPSVDTATDTQPAPFPATYPVESNNNSPANPTVDEASDIPVIELPNLDVQTQTAESPADTTTAVQMPANPETVAVNDAQTSQEEEAAIEQQIEQFIHTESVMPQTATVSSTDSELRVDTPEDNSANASIINSAVEELVEANQEEPSPITTVNTQSANAIVPEPTQEIQADPNSVTQIPGKKVLQPISNDVSKPDLATLVAQEEINENIARGVTGAAVVADVTQEAAEPTAPPLIINTDAPVAGGVFTPNTGGSAESNAL